MTPGPGAAVVGEEAPKAGLVTAGVRTPPETELREGGGGGAPAVCGTGCPLAVSGPGVGVGVAGSCPGFANVDGAATTPLARVAVG